MGAHSLRLFPEPSCPNAENNSTAGVEIEGCNRLSRDKRFALRQQTNTGTKPDPPGYRRGNCQGDERIDPSTIVFRQFTAARHRCLETNGNDWMLGNPERLITSSLDCPCDGVNCACLRGCRHKDAYVH